MKNKIIFGFILISLVLVTNILALDIGYVVRNGADSKIVEVIEDEEGLSYCNIDNIPQEKVCKGNYKVIKDSDIPNTNFFNYDLLILGKDIDNEDLIPYNDLNVLFFTREIAKNVWNLAGTETGKTLKSKVKISNFDSIILKNVNKNSAGEIQVYENNRAKEMHYLNSKPSYADTVIRVPGSNNWRRGVITMDNKLTNSKKLFFGLPEISSWTTDTQKMFQNSLNWLTNTQSNNPPTQTQTIPDLTWTKGTIKKIDLDNYFIDLDGDDLTYSFDSDFDNTNILVDINNNFATFHQENPNFTGTDWIIFKASDGQSTILSNKITLTVTQEPIDEVQITSYTPNTNNLKILKNTNKVFNIIISDTTKTIKWFLNNILQTTTGSTSTYNFNKDIGTYTLKASVGDIELTSHTWTINTKSIEDLTCSEASGFICSDTQSCSQDFLNTINERCCPLTCTENPFEFKDIDREIITNNITLEIVEPDTDKELLTGDSLKIKLDIDNNVDDKLDIDIKVYLYDLTEDEVVEDYEFTTEIDKESRRIIRFDIELPYDIDENHDYAFFVQINDEDEEYFNEDYVKINLDRDVNDIVIKKIQTIEQIYCGDYFNLDVSLINIGSEEQDVYITVESSALNINEKTETFELQAYNEKDTIKKDFSLKISDDTAKDIYPLKITAHFNNEKDTKEKQIIVDCAEVNTTNIDKIGVNGDKSPSKVSNKTNKTLLIFTLSLTTILTLGLIGSLVYIKKKTQIKTNKTSTKKINKKKK